MHVFVGFHLFPTLSCLYCLRPRPQSRLVSLSRSLLSLSRTTRAEARTEVAGTRPHRVLATFTFCCKSIVAECACLCGEDSVRVPTRTDVLDAMLAVLTIYGLKGTFDLSSMPDCARRTAFNSLKSFILPGFPAIRAMSSANRPSLS